MGYGDQLIATGLAKGAAARGRRVAFGHNGRIIWDSRSMQVFWNNPNIAAPGNEGGKNLEWIAYYKGQRGYNRQAGDRWVWNMDWRCEPGEMFFTDSEKAQGRALGSGFILVEPNVEQWKSSIASNKDWGWNKYQVVVDMLRHEGFRVVQFNYERAGKMLRGAQVHSTSTFRSALSVMANASLYVGVEGGLHHGAAALGLPAVVLFGGWIPPQVTGYPTHVNLTGGEQEPCGLLRPCDHCRRAMEAISVEEVYGAAAKLLGEGMRGQAGNQ